MADQIPVLFDRKKIILQNLPLTYGSSLIQDFVEGNLDIAVDHVDIFTYIPGRALVTLKCDLEDFTEASELIKKEKIEDQEIFLSQAYKMPSVVVEDIDFTKLEKEFLEMYLEVTFADCSDVISECHSYSSYNVAVVHFSEKHFEVVEKILAIKEHIPLPSENYKIKIIPFFKNFHDQIPLPDNLTNAPVEPTNVGTKHNVCDKKLFTENDLLAHRNTIVQKDLEKMSIKYNIDDSDQMKAEDAKQEKNFSDELDEKDMSDEQDNGASGLQKISYKCGDNGKMNAVNDKSQNFDSGDSSDEEINSDSTDEKDKHLGTSNSKRSDSGGSWSVKDKEIKSKNDARVETSDEETESDPNEDQDKVITEDEFEYGNSNDEQDRQQGKRDIRGNSYRGRGSVVMKSKCGTVKNFSNSTDEENDDSVDEQNKQRGEINLRGNIHRSRGSLVMKSKGGTVKKVIESTDEESNDSGDEQDEQQGKLDYRGNSYRGRGGVVMKSKGGTVKKVIESTDEESNDSGDEQDEQQGKLDYRGNSYRGRGSLVMKSKGGTVKKVSEESNDSGDEHDEQQSKLDFRGNSYRGRGGVVMKAKCGTVKNVKGDNTDEDIYNDNSNKEQEKQPGTMNTRGIPYRGGRGSSFFKAKNIKSKQDVNTIMTSENKLSNDNTCYRASNFAWGNMNMNTTNSTQIFKDHGNNNDEGSIENKNTVFYSRGRGFAGRGCRKNTFEKLSMVSGQTDGNNRGDLSETKMSQNNRTINPNPTFDKENSTKDLSKRVEELKKRKQEISEENARLTVESHSIPLTEIQAKCLQCYMKEYVECDIRYDSNLKSAILKGPKHTMQKCQLDFLLELKKVKEIEISLNNDVQNILSSEKGHTFLKNLNDLELKSAFVCLDSNSLKVGALDDVALIEATKMIKEKIEYAETLEGKSEIPLDEINLLKLKIENKYNTRVKWDTQKTQLIILGIKDDVLIARKEAEMFLEKYGVSEKSFDLGEPLALFFFSCLEEEIKHILKPVNTVNYISTKQQIAIRFKGSNLATTEVLHKLEEIKLQSKIIKWNLLDDFKAHEIFLIVNCYKSGSLKDIQEAFMYKKKCLIDLSNLSSFQLMLPESSSIRPKTKSKISKPHVAQTQTSVSAKSGSTNELVYMVTNTCQLVIKDGDIVQEKSDILVSVLGTDLDLRKTRVGGSFNRAYRSHWKEVMSGYDKNPNSLVVSVKKPQEISCLAVCHIIFEHWDPNISPGKLSSALQEVFNEAKLLGAKSISIPALGCGATFKFPPSNVAQIIFQVFLSLNIGSFLQKVVLLAADSDLSKEISHQATKHFKCLQLSPQSVKVSSPMTVPEVESSDDSSDESDDDFTKIDISSTNKNLSSTEIAIMTINEKQFENLKTEIKKNLTDHCLSTAYFCQDNLKFCPGGLRKKIVEKAKALSVWVARSKDPKAHNIGFLIKGEKMAVENMLIFIQQEFLAISSYLPQKRLTSKNAPKRGTLEFMQYASDSDEHFPSYWSLNESKSYWENIKAYLQIVQKRLIVDIDKETKDIIVNLVKKTFDPQLVKKDKAAEGLTHSSIKIINVQRVENVKLFEKYHDQRKTMFKKMLSMKKLCQDIGKIPGSKGGVGTAQYLSDVMKKELFYEVNEHYLFYGTDNFESVVISGLDPRNSASDGLFGKGIYASEMSSVADVYTDSKDNRSPKGTPMTFILARVILGNVFLCDHKNKHATGQGHKKLSRPPCMHCFEDRCTCHKQTLFDSVMADGNWLYRHFIIYEGNQIYPEYIITYERI